jgi:hypothetical protein
VSIRTPLPPARPTSDLTDERKSGSGTPARFSFGESRLSESFFTSPGLFRDRLGRERIVEGGEMTVIV